MQRFGAEGNWRLISFNALLPLVELQEEDLIDGRGVDRARHRHRYAKYPGHPKESETSINSDLARTLD